MCVHVISPTVLERTARHEAQCAMKHSAYVVRECQVEGRGNADCGFISQSIVYFIRTGKAFSERATCP